MALIFSGWNISKWASLSTIKSDTKVVSDLAQAVLSPSSQFDSPLNDWDQLMKKMGLSDQELQAKIKKARLMSRIYCSLGSALFGYSLYLLIHSLLMPGLATCVFSVLMFSYAFRDHRFVFNCENKKMNSTMIEWFSGTLGKKK